MANQTRSIDHLFISLIGAHGAPYDVFTTANCRVRRAHQSSISYLLVRISYMRWPCIQTAQFLTKGKYMLEYKCLLFEWREPYGASHHLFRQ